MDIRNEHGLEIIEAFSVKLGIHHAEVVVRRCIVRPHLRSQKEGTQCDGTPIAGKKRDVCHRDEPVDVDQRHDGAFGRDLRRRANKAVLGYF